MKYILNIIELHLIRHYNEIILGLSDCEDVLPIYIGDDRTDEDAFKVKIWKSYDGDGLIYLNSNSLLKIEVT